MNRSAGGRANAQKSAPGGSKSYPRHPNTAGLLQLSGMCAGWFVTFPVEPEPTSGPAPAPSGGAGIARPPESDGGIDATNIRDQATIRRAKKLWPKRWAGISDEKKQKWLDQLEFAGDVARKVLERPTRLVTDMNGQTAEVLDSEIALKAVNAVVSVVKTAAVIEGQNQSDEHLEAKIENPAAGDGAAQGPAIVFNITLATPPERPARRPDHDPIVLNAPPSSASADDPQAGSQAAPEAG